MGSMFKRQNYIHSNSVIKMKISLAVKIEFNFIGQGNWHDFVIVFIDLFVVCYLNLNRKIVNAATSVFTIQ